MGAKLDAAKIIAEIAKLGAEVYGIIKDKRREDNADRIRKLEAEIEALKAALAKGEAP